jgi:hypothetical protein
MRKLEKIICPCGREFEAELWNAINVSEDPGLKEMAIAGEVNVVCCPECGTIFYAEHFLLYQDNNNEILAFVYPKEFEKEAGHWHRKMETDFKQAMAALETDKRLKYKPLLIFGLDTLLELVRNDEDENDEVAILNYVSKEIGVRLIQLHPSLTRELQLVKLLPYVPSAGAPLRDQVLAGLEKLVAYNPNLVRYKENFEHIKNNKHWSLDGSAIKKMK